MRWRSVAAVWPILLCAVITSAHAQTADDLVAKNLAARGGAEKLAAIHSYITKGELRLPRDFKLAYTETRLRLDSGASAVRIDASVQGLTLIQAYDGKTAWKVNPFQGRKDPEQMNADEARALADEASIDGALLAATAKGSKVDYLGREDIDGTSAYKLRVSQADGTVFTYYLDPDVFLEIKVLERRTIRGAEQETETDLADYERVAGVYFPFSIASGPLNSADTSKQVITIASGQANVAVPASFFEMPVQPAPQSK
ncbi:MAG TPA: hypothetical protein VMD53_11715 [Rhizomicrobium sp.]|nr:hypothetical protein [Rhizomicrobium sp.]